MTQRTLVVKVGTSLLRAGDEFLQALAANLSAERQRGTRLVLVTSGAVGLGCNELGLPQRPQLCLLYTSPSPRDATLSRMPSSA